VTGGYASPASLAQGRVAEQWLFCAAFRDATRTSPERGGGPAKLVEGLVGGAQASLDKGAFA